MKKGLATVLFELSPKSKSANDLNPESIFSVIYVVTFPWVKLVLVNEDDAQVYCSKTQHIDGGGI